MVPYHLRPSYVKRQLRAAIRDTRLPGCTVQFDGSGEGIRLPPDGDHYRRYNVHVPNHNFYAWHEASDTA